MAGLEDRADALGDAVHRDLVHIVVEETCVVDAGPLGQRLDARAGGQRGTGLVEADVPVGADAEDLHVDAAGFGDRLVIRSAGAGDLLAVGQGSTLQNVTGHMHLRRVEAERLDHGAVDRRMI